jgi:hypothetical protein
VSKPDRVEIVKSVSNWRRSFTDSIAAIAAAAAAIDEAAQDAAELLSTAEGMIARFRERWAAIDFRS